jgi:RNA-binding protein
VLHVTKRGIVLQAEQTPKLGVPVYNGERKRVGQVWDVFGPIGNPYVLIRPAQEAGEHLPALAEKELFIRVAKHEKGKKAARVSRVRKPKART